MNSITTCRWSLLEDVVYFGERGFEAIGLWMPKLSEFGEERSRELLDDCGLEVSSVSWAGGFTGANGYSFREAVYDARDAIRFASELGAESLVVLSGGRAGHTVNHAKRLFVTALRQLAPLAGERGLKLAILPMLPMFSRDWTFLNSLDETLDIVHRVDHPSVGIAFDVYHLWREPRLLERIPELVPNVATVQLSDWRDPVRSEYDRCLPGDGVIPLDAIINAFLENGYGGYFDIQIWSEELWKSDYMWLLDRCRSALPVLAPA